MLTYECPTCHRKISCTKPEEAPYRPFCSSHCKLIDLGKWLNGEYRVVEEIPRELQDDKDVPRAED